MKGKPLTQYTTQEMYTYYELDANTQSFVGHAMALHRDDEYLRQPAQGTAEAIQLYMSSMQRYEPYKTPYIYPLFGLGGLPEGFSRLCAINGGTFMLNKPVDEILFSNDGVAWGIKAEGNAVAKASMVIGDPSYFAPEKSRVVGKVVRSICILNHPVPNTENAESVQIIIPAAQIKGRRNDIYVCMVSHAHNVASGGKYIAIVSTTVETADPLREIAPGIALLGPILERFDSVSDLFAPRADGSTDRCYISKSYDATSHFESAALDVLDLYHRITGEYLDMSISADMHDEDS